MMNYHQGAQPLGADPPSGLELPRFDEEFTTWSSGQGSESEYLLSSPVRGMDRWTAVEQEV